MNIWGWLKKIIPAVAKLITPVANLIRRITQPVPTEPSATDHTQARSPAHDTTAAENRADGPSLEELRRQEMAQRAATFDNDIARLSPQDDALDPGDAAPFSARQPFDIEIARLLQPELIPAELIVQAMGNPVAQSLLQMLRHERAHLDMFMADAKTEREVEQKLVNIFGPAEEDTVETREAAQIYIMATAQTDSGKWLRLRDIASKPALDSKARAKRLNGETEQVRYHPEGNNAVSLLDCAELGETVCTQLNDAFDRIVVPSPEIAVLKSQLVSGLESGDLNLAELEALALAMSDTFGYTLDLSHFIESQHFSGDQQRSLLLLNLLISNLNVVGYLDEVLAFGRENNLPVPGRTGLAIFRQVFGENGSIVVYLGANDTSTGDTDAAGNPIVIGAFTGLTPQYNDSLFLGSHVTAATITHEFGHQLDRYFDTQGSSFALSSGNNPDVMGFGTFLRDTAINRLQRSEPRAFTFGPDLTSRILRARANADPDNAELFADIFMTAVFNNRSLTVNPDAPAEGNSLVGFTDTENTRDVECAIRQYLLQILSGKSITRDDYIICE